MLDLPDDIEIRLPGEEPEGESAPGETAPAPDMAPEERAIWEAKLVEAKEALYRARKYGEKADARRAIREANAQLRGGQMERDIATWLKRRAQETKGAFDPEAFESALRWLPGWSIEDVTMDVPLAESDFESVVGYAYKDKGVLHALAHNEDHREGPEALHKLEQRRQRAVEQGWNPTAITFVSYHWGGDNDPTKGQYKFTFKTKGYTKTVGAVAVTAPDGETGHFRAPPTESIWKWLYDHGLASVTRAALPKAEAAIPPPRPVADRTYRTCAVCFRPVAMRHGMVVHHGYPFPGHRRRVGAPCTGSSNPSWEQGNAPTRGWLSYQEKVSRAREDNVTNLRRGVVREFSVAVPRKDAKGRKILDDQGLPTFDEVTVTPGHPWWAEVATNAWRQAVFLLRNMWGDDFRSIPWYRAAIRRWEEAPSGVRVGAPTITPGDILPSERYQGDLPPLDPPPQGPPVHMGEVSRAPSPEVPVSKAEAEVREFLTFLRDVLAPMNPSFRALADAVSSPDLFPVLVALMGEDEDIVAPPSPLAPLFEEALGWARHQEWHAFEDRLWEIPEGAVDEAAVLLGVWAVARFGKALPETVTEATTRGLHLYDDALAYFEVGALEAPNTSTVAAAAMVRRGLSSKNVEFYWTDAPLDLDRDSTLWVGAQTGWRRVAVADAAQVKDYERAGHKVRRMAPEGTAAGMTPASEPAVSSEPVPTPLVFEFHGQGRWIAELITVFGTILASYFTTPSGELSIDHGPGKVAQRSQHADQAAAEAAAQAHAAGILAERTALRAVSEAPGPLPPLDEWTQTTEAGATVFSRRLGAVAYTLTVRGQQASFMSEAGEDAKGRITTRGQGTVDVAFRGLQDAARQDVERYTQRSNGSLEPQKGDHVYTIGRGFEGSSSTIQGIALGKTVRITGAVGVFGAGAVARKTAPLNDSWLVVGDPKVREARLNAALTRKAAEEAKAEAARVEAAADARALADATAAYGGSYAGKPEELHLGTIVRLLPRTTQDEASGFLAFVSSGAEGADYLGVTYWAPADEHDPGRWEDDIGWNLEHLAPVDQDTAEARALRRQWATKLTADLTEARKDDDEWVWKKYEADVQALQADPRWAREWMATPATPVTEAPTASTEAALDAIALDLVQGPRPLYPEDPYTLTYRDRKRSQAIVDLAHRYGLSLDGFAQAMTTLAGDEGEVDLSTEWHRDALLHDLVGWTGQTASGASRDWYSGALDRVDAMGEGTTKGARIRSVRAAATPFGAPAGVARALKFFSEVGASRVSREANLPVWAIEARIARELVADVVERRQAEDERYRYDYEFKPEDLTEADAWLQGLPLQEEPKFLEGTHLAAVTVQSTDALEAAKHFIRWFIPRFAMAHVRRSAPYPDLYKQFATSYSVGDWFVQYGVNYYPAWRSFPLEVKYQVLQAAGHDFQAQGANPPAYGEDKPLSEQRIIDWLRTYSGRTHGDNPWSLEFAKGGIKATFKDYGNNPPFEYTVKGSGGKRDQMAAFVADPELWRAYYTYWLARSAEHYIHIARRWGRVSDWRPGSMAPVSVAPAAQPLTTGATLDVPALLRLPVGSIVRERDQTEKDPGGVRSTGRILVKESPEGWRIFVDSGGVLSVLFSEPGDFKYAPYTLVHLGAGSMSTDRATRRDYYLRHVTGVAGATILGTATPLSGKKLAAEVQRLYGVHFNGVAVNLMSLPSISAEIEAAILAGTVETDMPAIVAKWRTDKKVAAPVAAPEPKITPTVSALPNVGRFVYRGSNFEGRDAKGSEHLWLRDSDKMRVFVEDMSYKRNDGGRQVEYGVYQALPPYRTVGKLGALVDTIEEAIDKAVAFMARTEGVAIPEWKTVPVAEVPLTEWPRCSHCGATVVKSDTGWLHGGPDVSTRYVSGPGSADRLNMDHDADAKGAKRDREYPKPPTGLPAGWRHATPEDLEPGTWRQGIWVTEGTLPDEDGRFFFVRHWENGWTFGFGPGPGQRESNRGKAQPRIVIMKRAAKVQVTVVTPTVTAPAAVSSPAAQSVEDRLRQNAEAAAELPASAPRDFLPLPVNTVVRYSSGRRRYVIVRNTRLHGYNMLALSGGDKGSNPSGVQTGPASAPGRYPLKGLSYYEEHPTDLVVDPDQSITFEGAEADKRKREYEGRFHWKDLGGGRAEAGYFDAKPWAGLAYKQVPLGVGVAAEAPAPREASSSAAWGEKKATWTSPTFGQVSVIEGAQGKRDVWHNIAAAKGSRKDGTMGAVRYGWNGQRWARGEEPPDALQDEVVEHGWATLFGFPVEMGAGEMGAGEMGAGEMAEIEEPEAPAAPLVRRRAGDSPTFNSAAPPTAMGRAVKIAPGERIRQPGDTSGLYFVGRTPISKEVYNEGPVDRSVADWVLTDRDEKAYTTLAAAETAATQARRDSRGQGRTVFWKLYRVGPDLWKIAGYMSEGTAKGREILVPSVEEPEAAPEIEPEPLDVGVGWSTPAYDDPGVSEAVITQGPGGFVRWYGTLAGPSETEGEPFEAVVGGDIIGDHATLRAAQRAMEKMGDGIPRRPTRLPEDVQRAVARLQNYLQSDVPVKDPGVLVERVKRVAGHRWIEHPDVVEILAEAEGGHEEDEGEDIDDEDLDETYGDPEDGDEDKDEDEDA